MAIAEPIAAIPKPKLRWYQFSLRTLLIVVTLFAFVCSWLGIKMQQAKKQKEAVEVIHKIGGDIFYEYQVEAEEKLLDDEEPYGPICLRRMLGDDFFNDVSKVFLYSKVVDSDLKCLKGLKQLKQLNLKGAQITDAGLEHLEGLEQLEYLNLILTKVTDTGVEKLHKVLPKVKITKW